MAPATATLQTHVVGIADRCFILYTFKQLPQYSPLDMSARGRRKAIRYNLEVLTVVKNMSVGSDKAYRLYEACHWSFTCKELLTRHIMHVKPYTCRVCGKSRSRSNDPNRHQRIHTGENHLSVRNAHAPRGTDPSTHARKHNIT